MLRKRYLLHQLFSLAAFGLILVSCGQDQTGEQSGEFELPQVHTPWREILHGHVCDHVSVESRCEDGWCKIPAGCFIAGSPEEEPFRGAFSEDLRPVVLTRSFLMQQTEVTQEFWGRLVKQDPSGPSLSKVPGNDGEFQNCQALDCPVAHVNWWEAVEFANLLSRSEGFPECYVLKNCRGELGSRPGTEAVFTCNADYELTAPTVYECAGYRLPTVMEQEYAMRAGSRETTYAGPLSEEDVRECEQPLPHLDAIAWYCANSGNSSHPVAQKLANGWGLYDLFGNMMEWNQSRSLMKNPGKYPWVDPLGETGNEVDGSRFYRLKGGGFWSYPAGIRAAGTVAFPGEDKFPASGFRLVRTLFEEE